MQRIQRIEGLIQQIESSADPGTVASVRELVEALLEYHGAGLGRILELAGEGTTREFARDPLIASMLLLYDLHPDDLETRVRRTVDGLPGVLLISVLDGVVRLRSTSAHTVREAVERALYEAAPEIVAVEIEGVPASSFVPLEALQRAV
jgi:hypothetical protein